MSTAGAVAILVAAVAAFASGRQATHAHQIPATTPAPPHHQLGRSTEGRPILATELGDPRSAVKILVIGAVHGNEPAGIGVTRRLAAGPPPRHADVWIIDDLNPDGVAHGTRQNARGVDLNRNFPFDWQHLGRRGSFDYSGPAPLSEPESRIAFHLIERLHPAITIWFHQPLDLVDLSGGNAVLERRYAHLLGVAAKRLSRLPGSATGWQNHRLPGTTAFVVELPAGALPTAAAQRDATAVRTLADAIAPTATT